MYVFHGDLEAIEAAGLRDLDLLAKPLHLAANTCKVSPRNNDRGPGGGRCILAAALNLSWSV